MVPALNPTRYLLEAMPGQPNCICSRQIARQIAGRSLCTTIPKVDQNLSLVRTASRSSSGSAVGADVTHATTPKSDSLLVSMWKGGMKSPSAADTPRKRNETYMKVRLKKLIPIMNAQLGMAPMPQMK